MTVAAVVMMKEEDLEVEGRMDFIGVDCDNVDQALGELRDRLIKMKSEGQPWRMAMIVPDHTVEQVSMWGLEVEDDSGSDSGDSIAGVS